MAEVPKIFPKLGREEMLLALGGRQIIEAVLSGRMGEAVMPEGITPLELSQTMLIADTLRNSGVGAEDLGDFFAGLENRLSVADIKKQVEASKNFGGRDVTTTPIFLDAHGVVGRGRGAVVESQKREIQEVFDFIKATLQARYGEGSFGGDLEFGKVALFHDGYAAVARDGFPEYVIANHGGGTPRYGSLVQRHIPHLGNISRAELSIFQNPNGGPNVFFYQLKAQFSDATGNDVMAMVMSEMGKKNIQLLDGGFVYVGEDGNIRHFRFPKTLAAEFIAIHENK